MEFRVRGLSFRDWGLGFGVQGLYPKPESLRVWGIGGVWDMIVLKVKRLWVSCCGLLRSLHI